MRVRVPSECVRVCVYICMRPPSSSSALALFPFAPPSDRSYNPLLVALHTLRRRLLTHATNATVAGGGGRVPVRNVLKGWLTRRCIAARHSTRIIVLLYVYVARVHIAPSACVQNAFARSLLHTPLVIHVAGRSMCNICTPATAAAASYGHSARFLFGRPSRAPLFLISCSWHVHAPAPATVL